MVKVAWLLGRVRRRRSSPSVRQIVLAVVTAGLAIMATRALTRRMKSRRAGADAGTHDEARDSGSPPPTPRNDTVASEGALTNRVQSEMFRQSGEPAPATGSA